MDKLLESDVDQEFTIIVTNDKGSTNYTIMFENPESGECFIDGLNFPYCSIVLFVSWTFIWSHCRNCDRGDYWHWSDWPRGFLSQKK